MKKGVTMRVTLYIEGEDEPAHDFTETGRQVVTDILQAGEMAYTGPYTVKLEKMEPLEGSDDSDEG